MASHVADAAARASGIRLESKHFNASASRLRQELTTKNEFEDTMTVGVMLLLWTRCKRLPKLH
jgi:hypothetical protein